MTPLMPDVIVNGETIPSAAIAAEAQNHNAPQDKPGWAWKAAARAMAIRALLLQEGQRLGLEAEAREVAPGKLETGDEAMVRAVLETLIEPEQVSEAHCRAFYDRAPESFRAPSLFQPAHILFAARPEDAAARKTAMQNAQKALRDVLKDPKAFAGIAKAQSDCPSKENGGMLGQIGSGDTVPEFEAVLETLEAGQIHPEPVETRFGVHIIRMDEKAEGAVLPFEAVAPQIREKLEQVAWAKAAQRLTRDLVEKAEISGVDFAVGDKAA